MEQKDNDYLEDESIHEIFRAMHTIKGISGMMMFDEITKMAHKLEDVLFYLRENVKSREIQKKIHMELKNQQ